MEADVFRDRITEEIPGTINLLINRDSDYVLSGVVELEHSTLMEMVHMDLHNAV